MSKPTSGSEALVGALLVAGSFGLARLLSGRDSRVASGDRVLLVGDGVGQALAAPLTELGRRNQVSVAALVQPGSRTEQWAGSSVLQRKLEATQPSVVLAALGTQDELDGPGDLSKQLAAVDRLRQVAERGGARLAWVSPLRQRTSHFADGLAASLPRGALFDARRFVVQRGPDGVTPTARGAVGLAGSVWRWLT